jgi:UDP-MurNAc hydroxylase
LKLTFITNACCIYEQDGYKILTDPWLTEGIFYGAWFHDPPITTTFEDIKGVDAIYISHVHPDHLDEAVMERFAGLEKKPIIILYEDKYNFARKVLDRIGSWEYLLIKDHETKELGPFKLTMFGPFTKHPFTECEIGNVVDSALLVEVGGYSILNTNDNTPSVEAAYELMSKYGSPTIAQLNYNSAGPYPACFDNLSAEAKKAEADKNVERQLNHMVKVARILGPELVMPFAGAYKLGGEFEWMNPFLGTTTPDHVRKYFQENANCYDILLLKEGESYNLEHEFFLFRLTKARAKLWEAQKRFNYVPDLRVSINGIFAFRFDQENPLAHTGSLAEPYLKCTMKPEMLSKILNRECHWNNAEIGCHIRFERVPNTYLPDVHTLMSFFHT